MTGAYNGEREFDEWTGMPIETESDETMPLAIADKKQSRFDFGSMLWRYVASGNGNTPAQILTVLATDNSPRIRKRCGENLSTPGNVLALLGDDQSDAVRLAVAKNRHTPLYVLRKLAHDPSPKVRFAIASNPEMPDAILLSLFMDPDATVAERASQTMAA